MPVIPTNAFSVMKMVLTSSSTPVAPEPARCIRSKVLFLVCFTNAPLLTEYLLLHAFAFFLCLFQERKGMEGSLFIVRRSSHPHFKVTKQTQRVVSSC